MTASPEHVAQRNRHNFEAPLAELQALGVPGASSCCVASPGSREGACTVLDWEEGEEVEPCLKSAQW